MTKISEYKNKKIDILICVALCIQICFLPFINCLNAFTETIGFHTSIDTIICYGFLFFSFVVFIYASFKIKINYLFFIIPIVLFLSYVLTLSINYSYISIVFGKLNDIEGNSFYCLFVYSLPCLLLIAQLGDLRLFKNIFVKISYIVVLLSAFVYFFAQGSSANQYMTLSYNMLTSVMAILFLEENNKVMKVLTLILGIFVLIFSGTRGALVALLCSIILYMIFVMKKSKKKVAILFLVVIALLFIFLFYEQMFGFLSDLLKSLGIESRLIELIKSSSLATSNERLDIYKKVSGNFTMTGSGLFGDRILLRDNANVYSHNLFIEIVYDYGFIFGSIFSILLLFVIIKAFIKSSLYEKKLFLVLLPCGFIKLLFSGSYLNQEPVFYLFIGLCLKIILKKEYYEQIATS